LGHDLTFQSHVTSFDSPIGGPLKPNLYLNRFRDIWPQTSNSHRQNLHYACAISRDMQNLSTYFNFSPPICL